MPGKYAYDLSGRQCAKGFLEKAFKKQEGRYHAGDLRGSSRQKGQPRMKARATGGGRAGEGGGAGRAKVGVRQEQALSGGF